MNRNGRMVTPLSVLRLLFQDARSWWYHRKLRDRGDIAEARRLERHSVRKHLEDLREATVLHVGRGGWTLYRRSGRLEGHGRMQPEVARDPFVQAAIGAGVPVFDTTTVPDEKLGVLLGGPCPAHDPLGALEHARALGARVYNGPQERGSNP